MKGEAHEHTAIDWTDLPRLQLVSNLPPSPPTNTEVHLWLIHLDVPQQTIQACQLLLSRDEHERVNRLRFQHLRDRSTVTRAALRQILASYLDTSVTALQFIYGPQGKPSLTDQAIHHLTFNLSHSRDLAMLAVTTHNQVGVDLEFRESNRDLAQIATRSFSPAEAAAIASLPEDQRTDAFYACWTLMEAYLKATGDGLSTPLDSFEVRFPPLASASVTGPMADRRRWQSWSLTLENFAAAAVVEGPHHSLSRSEWVPGMGELR